MTDSLELLQKRVEELESQAAFQDELHESLNTIVAKQDAEILELKRQVGQLFERLRDLGDAVPGGAAQDEVPPHY
jgi:SlyX protein